MIDFQHSNSNAPDGSGRFAPGNKATFTLLAAAAKQNSLSLGLRLGL